MCFSDVCCHRAGDLIDKRNLGSDSKTKKNQIFSRIFPCHNKKKLTIYDSQLLTFRVHHSQSVVVPPEAVNSVGCHDLATRAHLASVLSSTRLEAAAIKATGWSNNIYCVFHWDHHFYLWFCKRTFKEAVGKLLEAKIMSQCWAVQTVAVNPNFVQCVCNRQRLD